MCCPWPRASDGSPIADETRKGLRCDLLVPLCAARAGATSGVLLVSSNPALERISVCMRCRRIRNGSPYVIVAKTEELATSSRRINGYGAKGSFLLRSSITGVTAIRDAVLQSSPC
jgi:hypothetical protein